MSDSEAGGVDISPLHRELDRLKTQLCRCNHNGDCLACRGFEVLRQQSQMVVAAASQPVLMQVAQEAAMKDMLAQLSGAGEKLQARLGDDARLQDLMAQVMERVQEDLGGPEEVEKLLRSLGIPGMGGEGGFPFGSTGGMPGFGGGPSAGDSAPDAPGPTGADDARPPRRPYDDIPPDERGGGGGAPPE